MLLLAERWRMGLCPVAPSQVAAHAATPGPGPLRSASGLPGQLAFPWRLFTILPPTASVLLPGLRPKWLPPVLVQGSSPGGAPGPLVVRPASSPSCGSRWAGWGPHPWSASRVRVWIRSPSHRWTAVQGSMADPPHANCHGQSTCLPLGGAPINATGTFPLLYPGQRGARASLAIGPSHDQSRPSSWRSLAHSFRRPQLSCSHRPLSQFQVVTSSGSEVPLLSVPPYQW